MMVPGRLVLLGHPVSHSLSPRIQNAALDSAGIPLRYEALDVEPASFEATFRTLRDQRAAGNVTVPFKERAFAACRDVSALAKRVGAVNTWWVDPGGGLRGDNTDVGGFEWMVRREIADVRELSVGVIGAGGAAAAVLAAVESWPNCLAHVWNRTPERARTLCERFGSAAHPVDDIGVVAGADVVVNATSVGLKDDAFPIDLALIRRESVVFDLVYRPGETRFVRELRQLGIRATDGLPMLVEQAALAFEKWFGVTADRDAMWRAAGAM
jgi:shikimate dehydrogenase